jgi:hypothetical protein
MRSIYTTLKISTYVNDNTRLCVMVSIHYSMSLVSNIITKEIEFLTILYNRNEFLEYFLGVVEG